MALEFSAVQGNNPRIMGCVYEKMIRPVLFRWEPEKAHDLGVTALDYLGRCGPLCGLMERYNAVSRIEPIELFGLKFPNAVGLAAGMDKNAKFWRAVSALGFGHIEVGTVTRHKQPGNPSPRVFRYPEYEALINRMGFNNDGAEIVAQRLRRARAAKKRNVILGVNIGKSKVTPLEQAAEDYLGSFNLLAEYADYFTINVSSPNTPGLRKLQDRGSLMELLSAVMKANRSRAKKLGERPKPLLLKIAPDLGFRQIDDILEVVADVGIDGIVATNTTITRPPGFKDLDEQGGLSGKPLHARACEVVNYIALATSGRLPIIGVGGIDDAVSAGRMMDAGASLVQVYTGFVYRGPFMAKIIARAIAPRHGFWV